MKSCLRLVLLVSCSAIAVASVTDYNVGDKATTDVRTPVQLVVVDQERTELLRHQEAQRVPAIFRFNTNAAAEAEIRMLTGYTAAKEGFLKAVERAYKKRTLDDTTVAQERFARAVSTYQKQNRSFPLTTNLAMTWALGESDQVLLEDLAMALQEAVHGYIRPDSLSGNAKLGPQQARVVMVGSTNVVLDLDAALARSVSIHKSNFVGVGSVRRQLQAKFGEGEQWAGKFLSGFVRENCVCDENFTWQSRARRSDPILAADTYEAGTVLVKAGALIDVKIKAALDELARRTEPEVVKAQAAKEKEKADALAVELKEAAAQEKRKAEAAASELAKVSVEQKEQVDAMAADLQNALKEQQRKADAAALELKQAAMKAHMQRLDSEERYRMLLVVVVIGSAMAMIFSWMIFRRRQTTDLLPVLASDESTPAVPSESVNSFVTCPSCNETIPVVSPALRDGLLPELTRWFKQQFVQRLAGSAKILADTQRLAALQVAELERKLQEVKGPIQERLKAYEQRIIELERDLEAKGAENRELLKATIQLARERLEAHRAHDGVGWN